MSTFGLLAYHERNRRELRNKENLYSFLLNFLKWL